jgi:hypothetical protein
MISNMAGDFWIQKSPAISLVCRDGTAGCRVSEVTIGGNVRIDRNVPPSSGLSGSTIANNVIVTQNSGKYVLVGDNTIAGNLICVGNEPPPSGRGASQHRRGKSGRPVCRSEFLARLPSARLSAP